MTPLSCQILAVLIEKCPPLNLRNQSSILGPSILSLEVYIGFLFIVLLNSKSKLLSEISNHVVGRGLVKLTPILEGGGFGFKWMRGTLIHRQPFPLALGPIGHMCKQGHLGKVQHVFSGFL